MGINFTAAFIFDFEATNLLSIAAKLNDKKEFSELHRYTFAKKMTQEFYWTFYDSEWNTVSSFDYGGHAKIYLYDLGDMTIKGNIIEFWTFYRWFSFLENDELQLSLRKICFELSKLFGNPVYIPDVYCVPFDFEGNNYQEFEVWLKQEMGLPTTNLKSILDDYEKSTIQKYYIEEFKDINL